MSRPGMMLFSHVCGSSFITGAEKYVLMLAVEASRHFDCTLVVPSEGLLLTEARQRGIRTVVYDIPLFWPMYDPGADLIHMFEQKLQNHEHSGIVNLLHMYQPSIVVVNTCVNPLPAAAAKSLGIPVAWCITEKMAEQAHTAKSVDRINRYSDWIIGISETTLRPFRQAGLDAKLSLLPPTWSMDELHPEGWAYNRQLKRNELLLAPHSRVVGYISSSLHQEKGLEHFVHMALSVCGTVTDVHFLIAGNATDVPYMAYCQSVIDQSGYAARFHRIAFEPRIELIYPAMDLVVIPSLIDEGFGMTALEGLVFGKGVIAYRSGGLEEILRTTGNTSWIVEKGDTVQLTASVNEWLLNSIHQHHAGNNNQKAAAAVYGLESYRERLQKLIAKFQAQAAKTSGEGLNRPLPPLLTNMVYKGAASSAVFLLENGVKRPFASTTAFVFFKYRWSDVNPVSDAILHRYPTGAPISTDPPFHGHRPSVMLAKGKGPTVYLLAGGHRYPVSSRTAMRQRGLDPDRVVQVPDAELRQLPLGEPLRQLYKEKRRRGAGKRRKLVRWKKGRKVLSGKYST